MVVDSASVGRSNGSAPAGLRLAGTTSSSTKVERRRAVLVGPHRLWLEAVEQVLSPVSVEVADKATSFADGTELIEQLQPALVVAEISAVDSETSGLSWLADICQRFPQVKVIALSRSDDPADINAALSAGAVAFVVKKARPDDQSLTALVDLRG